MKYFLMLWALLSAFGFANAQAEEMKRQSTLAEARVQNFTLPSPQPSGFENNDKIVFDYYAPRHAARGSAGGQVTRAPAIILLHQLMLFNVGGEPTHYMQQAAQYVAARGVAAAVITLPYHGKRAVPGRAPLSRFISGDAAAIEQAFGQSVADVRAVTDWLIARPEIDPQKLACFGASLGAIVTHLAMGQDERLRAGVAVLGGGDLASFKDQSFLVRFVLKNSVKKLNEEQLQALSRVDPITYADKNRPRQVLMIQAARDLFVSPQAARKLWDALGRPPIRWIDTNHMALILSTQSAVRAALSFIEASWNGATPSEAAAQTPRLTVPTLKLGWLTGLDSRLTPAIQYQALTLGSRKHMSLFGANLGLSGRGPFVGLAATATPFIDLGFAYRLNGGQGLKPYASFHVVF